MFHLGGSKEEGTVLGRALLDDLFVAPRIDASLQVKRAAEEKIRVAVYNAAADGGKSAGHKGILATLQAEPDLDASYTADLSLASLLRFHVLVIPDVDQLGASEQSLRFVESVRRFVMECGGGAYFQHDACGYEGHGWVLGQHTLFPTICRGVSDRVTERAVLVRAPHEILDDLEAGHQAEHMYVDHMALMPGDEGLVLVEDSQENAVVVCGRAGEGRVVFDGMITYLADPDREAEQATGIDRTVLLGGIRWLAGEQ